MIAGVRKKRAPRLELVIVRSTTHPAALSLRVPGGSGSDLKIGLVRAGFKPGDRVVLRLKAVRS